MTTAGSLNLASGSSATNQTITALDSSVLLDDFTNGITQTNIGLICGGGRWYDASDTSSGGTSTVTASPVGSPDAYSGNSIKIDYTLGSTAGAWSLEGFFLGSAPSYDLSALKAITFMAKGSGTIEVSIFSSSLDSIPYNTSHFACNVTLTSNWAAYTIPVDSLKLATGSPAALAGKTWSDAAPTSMAIRFMAFTDTARTAYTESLYLDDIKLTGVSLETFDK